MGESSALVFILQKLVDRILSATTIAQSVKRVLEGREKKKDT